jgi:hypothetical protein
MFDFHPTSTHVNKLFLNPSTGLRIQSWTKIDVVNLSIWVGEHHSLTLTGSDMRLMIILDYLDWLPTSLPLWLKI